MILSLLKTYALQVLAILLGVSALFAGLQTWRLSSAHEKIDEQRQLIVDVTAANMVQQASIDALRKANADWSTKCKADAEKWSATLEAFKAEAARREKALLDAPRQREVIYRESNDQCATIPVPAGIIERLRN
jgi:hypothetical protein